MSDKELREALLEQAIDAGDLRAALRDMIALMPANRYELLRPSTKALIDEFAPDEAERMQTDRLKGRVTGPLDQRLKVNRAR